MYSILYFQYKQFYFDCHNEGIDVCLYLYNLIFFKLKDLCSSFLYHILNIIFDSNLKRSLLPIFKNHLPILFYETLSHQIQFKIKVRDFFILDHIYVIINF
jgi:hypothetical protein